MAKKRPRIEITTADAHDIVAILRLVGHEYAKIGLSERTGLRAAKLDARLFRRIVKAQNAAQLE